MAAKKYIGADILCRPCCPVGPVCACATVCCTNCTGQNLKFFLFHHSAEQPAPVCCCLRQHQLRECQQLPQGLLPSGQVTAVDLSVLKRESLTRKSTTTADMFIFCSCCQQKSLLGWTTIVDGSSSQFDTPMTLTAGRVQISVYFRVGSY